MYLTTPAKNTAWAGCLNCYLDVLDKPQKQLSHNKNLKTVNFTITASREPLTHFQNVVSQSLSIGILW